MNYLDEGGFIIDDLYRSQSTGSNSVLVPDRGGTIQQEYEGVRSILNWNPLTNVGKKAFTAGIRSADDPSGFVADVAENVKSVTSRIPEKLVEVTGAIGGAAGAGIAAVIKPLLPILIIGFIAYIIFMRVTMRAVNA